MAGPGGGRCRGRRPVARSWFLLPWRDDSALRGLRHQPQDGLHGSVAIASTPSRSVDGAGAGRGDCRSAPGRPHWGPRKLRAVLMGERPEAVWPAAARWAPRWCGRAVSSRRRRRRRVAAPGRPFRAGAQPGRTLRPADRQRRLQPFPSGLCIADRHGPRGGERLFKRYGVPLAIRRTTGHPSPERARGLSRLSVGWIKAGIALERIEPGQPQQNGRHERIRTLKAETAKPPAATRSASTAPRPRGAWPSRLRRSTGPRCGLTPNAWTRTCDAIAHRGSIKWGATLHQALKGEPVGIAETDSGDWIVRFAEIDLGISMASPRKRRTLSPGSVLPRTVVCATLSRARVSRRIPLIPLNPT